MHFKMPSAKNFATILSRPQCLNPYGNTAWTQAHWSNMINSNALSTATAKSAAAFIGWVLYRHALVCLNCGYSVLSKSRNNVKHNQILYICCIIHGCSERKDLIRFCLVTPCGVIYFVKHWIRLSWLMALLYKGDFAFIRASAFHCICTCVAFVKYHIHFIIMHGKILT